MLNIYYAIFVTFVKNIILQGYIKFLFPDAVTISANIKSVNLTLHIEKEQIFTFAQYQHKVLKYVTLIINIYILFPQSSTT